MTPNPFVPMSDRTRRASLALALAAACLLAACGGGGSSAAAPASCSLDAQKSDLATSLQDTYLWYTQLRSPDPAGFDSLSGWLGGIVSAGVPGNNAFPADRWSGLQATSSFNSFFRDGESLGYGVSVAGVEVRGTAQPLRVRYVEPLSPAATAGVRRGDTIVRVNGRAATELTQADDFTWLETTTAGTRLQLQLRDTQGGLRDVTLVASTYALQPVSVHTVLNSPGGRSVGYLVLKDFISQSSAPLDAAFASFRAAGVQELVLDLRYNGGGLVQLAADLASRVNGTPAVQGQPFTRLVYSDKRSASNFSFPFSAQNQALTSLTRVYVLTGSRTCSASELLINGLQPFIDVVQIGGTTCGKPVGFQPRDNGCGSTVSAVNFESLNASGEGRYWDGLRPRCAVVEDWNRALGDPAEVLIAAALTHADTGSCPAPSASESERMQGLSARLREAARSGVMEPGERRGMWVP